MKRTILGGLGLAAAAAMSLGGTMRNLAPVELSSTPEPVIRDVDNRGNKKLRVEESKRTRRRADTQMQQRRAAPRSRGFQNPEFQAAVDSLSHWQRKRWAGAGYPGLRQKEIEKVKPFAALVRAA